jgi:cell wall-associated NlpC family hydrolase
MPACLRAWRVFALTIAVLTALALALSLSTAFAPSANAVTERRLHEISNAFQVARNQKGDPYRWGANGPYRFDCSGLTQFSYGRAGLYLPRTSDAQARYARRIKKRGLQKGDLMFFHRGGGVYHVGIFAGWDGHGRRLVLHAPSPGERVHTSTIWTRSWFAGTLRGR